MLASKRLNLVTHHLYKSFGGLLGTHDKATPCRWKLQIRKKDSRSGSIVEIENPSIVCNAHDLYVLNRREANALPDSVAVREQAFRQATAHDRNTWMPFIISPRLMLSR